MSIRDKAKSNAKVIDRNGTPICCTTVPLTTADWDEAKQGGRNTPAAQQDYILEQTAFGCSDKCDCGNFPAMQSFKNPNTSYAECQQDPSQLKHPPKTGPVL